MVDIFMALIEERQIILVMKDISDSAVLIQSFCDLLKPLEWTFSIVPNVTELIYHCIFNPQGCFLGVPEKVWNEHCFHMKHEIYPEAVIFFLDSNEV